MKRFIRGLISTLELLFKPKLLLGETYFPEKPRKNKFRIICEQLMHSLKYGEYNKYYFVYGMDVLGKKDGDYMDYYSFIKLRDGQNMTKPYSYICLLRDKQLFGIVADAYGLQTASNVAVVHDGISSKPINELLVKHNHLFCKPVDSLCGNGVFELSFCDNDYFINTSKSPYDSLLKYVESLKGDFIIQPFVKQHKDISTIYDKCINTVRIVTVNPNKTTNPDEIVILASLLRIGVGGMNVDNWAKGGIVVGITPNGRLMKYGFYKPGHGTKTEKHPDSGIVFEGREIPMYDELTKQVKFFHSKLNGIYTIGWDVAITDNGPLFIEGNDNYELGFLQTCFGGMRCLIEKYLK